MTIEELQIKFEEDTLITEAMIDKQIIAIPKMMSKYIFAYSDRLKLLSECSCQRDELFHNFMMEYRAGKTDISKFTWSATELKKMIETSPRYLELSREEYKHQNELKVIEEMIQAIKAIGYSMNNYIAYKKLMNGVI